MICGDKEWKNCRVEKLGCRGCFYRDLTNEEVEQCIKELTEVRPEKLDDKGLRLFKAIMQILDERDELRKKEQETREALELISSYILEILNKQKK